MSKPDKLPTNLQTSRRNFLKTSAAITGTTIAGGLSINRSAHAAGDEVLKVGLIGCGGRGSGAAVNALNADKNTKLIAMADLFEDHASGSRERIKKIKGDQVAVNDDHMFVGFDAYKQLIQSGVDVVLIAAASHFHPMHLKAAVDAGKHVFVEKPHAVDAPGVRMVLDTCEQAKKKNLSVVSGLCWRYHLGMRETMKRVMDGAIGEIVAIQETYIRSIYSRHKPCKPDCTEMERQLRNWYHFNWLSGDDILQSLVHSLDKAAWAMRDEPPVRAWGTGGREVCTGPEYGDLFDHHAVVYEYANGVRVYGYNRTQDGCYNEVTDHVVGAKGRCNLVKHHIKDTEGKTIWRYKGPSRSMHQSEHDELFASIRAGTPINNGLYMARSTMLGILGRMATYTGQVITWDQAMNSKEVLAPKRYDWDAKPPVMPKEDGTYPTAIPGVTKFV